MAIYVHVCTPNPNPICFVHTAMPALGESGVGCSKTLHISKLLMSFLTDRNFVHAKRSLHISRR